MADTAAGILLDTIHEWGVDVIFGLPGDGINGVMEALRQRQDQIRFVQVRHEEAAALSACGYAKYTGRLGACLATSGPGGIHLLNGLYDAKMDGQPVLAITGHHFHDLIGTHAQQDVDLDRLFADVAVYSERVMGPAHVENVADVACRAALTERGVAHINFPVDFQSERAQHRSERNRPHHGAGVLAQGAHRPPRPHSSGLPAEDELQRAAEVLNAGKKVTILAGRGALGAGEELEQVAERLLSPIVKAPLGKACVPDESSYSVGGLGLFGTLPAQEAMAQCDTLFLVGTSFPYVEFYPKPGQARVVQLDIDPRRIGLRCPVEVGLMGESKATLRRLLPLLQQKKDRSFLEQAQAGMAQWWRLMAERSGQMDRPMKPQVVAWELGKRLPHDAIVSSDSGTIATWFSSQLRVKRGQMHSLSGSLTLLGTGLPYAIAAQLAYPARPSVAFVGDAGFSMLMAEFATAVKYRLPIKVVVLKHSTSAQVRWEQMLFSEAGPGGGPGEARPIDFSAFARACGGTGFSIVDPAECGRVLDQALAAPGPVLIEAEVDPAPPQPLRPGKPPAGRPARPESAGADTGEPARA